jgi:hypothetical protein
MADKPLEEVVKALPAEERAKIDMRVVKAAQDLARQREEDDEEALLFVLLNMDL